ncbi:MAG: tRNA pseudouridine(55) synthase TruB [Candidatus Omnitrophica bacterium]|nr:tRNA pseudouridine(55) synthase TruB [Candidatus Omnitrophota bacterium]
MKSIDGILAVDKPQGWTSHDVCAFVRKRFRIPKVGHAGTLDPLATGVLVLLIGKATKLSQDLSSCDKDYFGTFELGVETDSHDRDGRVIREATWEGIDLERIRGILPSFVGEIEQIPPMISAIRYKGVRLYHLARRGTEVPREKRRIVVHEFRVEDQKGPFVHFFARVSKGTYLRTLVHDIGETLGCHATLSELRRVRAGDFRLEEAVTVEALKKFALDELERHLRPLSSFPPYAYLG